MQSKKHPVQGTAVPLRLGGTRPVAFVPFGIGKLQLQRLVVVARSSCARSRDPSRAQSRGKTVAKPWRRSCWIFSPASGRFRKLSWSHYDMPPNLQSLFSHGL